MKLRKQKSSPYWYGRVLLNGKDRWISSGTTGKKEAERIIRQKIALLKGSVSADNLFEGLLKVIEKLPATDAENKKQDFASRLLQGKNAKLALKDAWETWEHSPMKRNPGPRTISSYKSMWNRFEAWASDQGIKFLHEVGDATAQSYCQSLRKAGLASRTYNGHLKFLMGAFKALKVQAGLIKNVWADIPTLKKQTESRRNLAPEELKKVCMTAQGALKYMLAIGIFTGVRLGDVVSMEWKNVDLDNGIIEIIPGKTKRTGKKVRLPILPQLDNLLRELRSSSNSKKYLFPEEHELYQNSPPSLSRRIQKHFEHCGIKTTEPAEAGQRRRVIVRVGFHSLRHSFVSMLVKNKVPQTAIAALVGHGSPVMTENYTHLDDEQRTEALSGISKLIDFNSGDFTA